jgi:signal peptidase I
VQVYIGHVYRPKGGVSRSEETMLSTTILIAMFWIFVIAAFFLWTYFLWLGARWTKIAGVTYRRALLAGLLVNVAELVVCAPFLCYAPTNPVLSSALSIVQLVAVVLTAVLILSMLFKAARWRCLLTWLATWIPQFGMLALAFLVVRPFVLEPFVASSNAMAPTMLGPHWEGVCPQCGRPTYCTPEKSDGSPSGRPHWVICENFHTTKSLEHDKPLHPSDRFSVNKLLKPQRWDLVVFRYPDDPKVLFVQRLVGLPGEVVTVQNGALWINGRAISPPEALQGLKYVTEMEGCPDELWGTPQRPAKLAADECFVLGDFSHASKDSRLFQSGAPGHPPYAVPASYLYGVVTHIYWPPGRWRAFR